MSTYLFRILPVSLLLLACGGRHSGDSPGPSSPGIAIDAVECPGAQESISGKVGHEAYLRAHSEETQTVTVHLRPVQWKNSACASAATSPGCPDRDGALAERQALNRKQVECVLAAFGSAGSVAARGVWYEPLQTPSSGAPTPIGTAFSVQALWSQLEVVAGHPYVERIEPGFGQAAKLGVAVPAIPSECPSPSDSPEMKLNDLAIIRGQGRKPAVVVLKEALLPPVRPCTASPCDDRFASGWERTVASTRQTTCVRRFIDSQLQAEAPELPYYNSDGIPDGPKLPPFGDSIHATLAFGLSLTWEEAKEIAKHPYVERIWSSNGLTVDSPPGCPPDYRAPVKLPECTTNIEPTGGKFSQADAVEWQASGGPISVSIAIRREHDLCPPPECADDASCPERDRFYARLTDEARASQACVRSLIASIGGSVSDEVFFLGNGLSATLTWAQIQTVAAHPDVDSISGGTSGLPPP